MIRDGIYPSALPSGTRVGATVLQRAIGQGAWGIVYEGSHDTWGRVAVKEYCPTQYSVRSSTGNLVSTSPRWQDAVRRGLEKFRAEGMALRTINHPGVVRVIDMVEANDTLFLVMDFIEGEPLSESLAAGRMSAPREVVAFTDALLSTLESIHGHGVIHRDISPDNIMITREGRPILIDFGGAAAAISEVTRSSSSIVKDGYSPPEQYEGEGTGLKIGPWSDIYSAGAVLHRMVSGHEPPASNMRLLKSVLGDAADPMASLVQLAPRGYSPTWLAATEAALELLPNRRPQSVNAWRELFAENPSPSPRWKQQPKLDSILKPSGQKLRDQVRAPVAVIVCGALVLAAGSAWMGWVFRPAPGVAETSKVAPPTAPDSKAGAATSPNTAAEPRSKKMVAADKPSNATMFKGPSVPMSRRPVSAERRTPPIAKPEEQTRNGSASEDRLFIVYFDFDRTSLSPEGQSIIQQAAEYATTKGARSIAVVGYDRGTSGAYAQRVGMRRASAVSAALVGLGVSGSIISTMGKGESIGGNEVVGVNEPANRRATIEVSF